jgi:hypothetical protein
MASFKAALTKVFGERSRTEVSVTGKVLKARPPNPLGTHRT